MADLRAMLKRKVDALSVEAMRQEGSIDRKALGQAKDLADIVQLRASLQPTQSRPRWPVAMMLLMTLALLSLLLFARVNETEIELNAVLAEVSFELHEAVLLTEQPLPIRSLGISGVHAVTLPRSRDAVGRRLAAAGDSLALRLRPHADTGPDNSLSLGGLALPAGTRVRLTPLEGGKGVRLELSGKQSIRVQATARGRIAVDGLVDGRRVLELAAPRQFDFEYEGDTSPLVLVFEPAAGRATDFADQLPVVDLSMSRVEDLPGTERSIVRELSTLRSGELYLEELGGRELLLRSGEALRFESSRGAIRSIRSESDGVALQYRGSVTGMATGSLGKERSLMPTWLEWISVQHGLSLLWGGTLYMFGLVLTVVRWWSRS